MGERWKRFTCLIAIALLVPSGGGTAETEGGGAPSLEYAPSSEVVPLRGETIPVQPPTFFTTAVGGFGITEGSFDRPIDVAHDSEENYYVLDAGNNRVQKFTRRDRFLLQWGTRGAGEGAFDRPRAIVVDDEDFVYVVDSGNHRIQKFDSDGTFMVAFGSLGAAPGKFNSPTDIVFDESGNVYVLDVGNDRIQEFNSAGIFIDEWGRFSGGRAGDFKNLVSIAWFRERFGYLFLLGTGLEVGSCQVQMLRLKGGRREVVRVWEVTYPEDVECSAVRMEIDNYDDYVYILDSIWTAEVPFNGPMGFSVKERTRNIWIADTGNNIVQRFALR